jgi:hypothetical protein
MAFMKRIQIELLALGFAAATMALFADHGARSKPIDSRWLTDRQARAESALYLDAPPTHARLDRAAGRWAVTDGSTTAWLDARSGELLEVELDARLGHTPQGDRGIGARSADHREPAGAVASPR